MHTDRAYARGRARSASLVHFTRFVRQPEIAHVAYHTPYRLCPLRAVLAGRSARDGVPQPIQAHGEKETTWASTLAVNGGGCQSWRALSRPFKRPCGQFSHMVCLCCMAGLSTMHGRPCNARVASLHFRAPARWRRLPAAIECTASSSATIHDARAQKENISIGEFATFASGEPRRHGVAHSVLSPALAR